MRFISASAMPFSDMLRFRFGFLVFLFFALFQVSAANAGAELIDRVIAFVDDTAITLREFNDYYEKMSRLKADISRDEAINTMINRVLLMREAKKLKIEAPTDDELLNEYIELKVRAFIRIKEDDIKDFYNLNPSRFKDSSYESVRDMIEDYLVQLELNRLLKRHIEELRAGSYIQKMLTESNEEPSLY